MLYPQPTLIWNEKLIHPRLTLVFVFLEEKLTIWPTQTCILAEEKVKEEVSKSCTRGIQEKLSQSDMKHHNLHLIQADVKLITEISTDRP